MLLGFSLGVWALVVGYTFVKVLNARGANLRATVVTIAAFGASIVVNLTFYRHWGPVTVGLPSSVCGLVMFVGGALALGALRFSLTYLGVLAPGVLAAGWVGNLVGGASVLNLATSCMAMAVVLLGYIAAVPQLRESLSGILVRLRPSRAATDPSIVGQDLPAPEGR